MSFPANYLDSTQESYGRGIKKLVHKVSTPNTSSGRLPNFPSGSIVSVPSSQGRTPVYFPAMPEPDLPAHSVAARHTYEDTIWYKDTTNDNDYRNFETCISADGELNHSKRGMICNSSRFSVTKPQGHMGSLDNVKYLAYHSDEFNVIGDEVIYEIEMSACQVFEEQRPIPREFIPRVQNIHQDYRLCCSASVLYDEISMVGLYFLLTNDAIYGMYERKQGAKIPKAHVTPADDHASFVASKFLIKRGRGHEKAEDILDDTYILAIGIDRISRCIRWYINGIELWTVTHIGYRVDDQFMVLERGGSPVLTEITRFSCGFGHFSFLDHQLPNNYSRELVRKDTSTDNGGKVYRSESALVMLNFPETYREVLPDLYGRQLPIIPSGTFAITADSEAHKLFGQGVITCIKWMRVYTRSRSRTPCFTAPVRYTHEKLEEYDNSGSEPGSDSGEDVGEVEEVIPPRQPFPIINVPIPSYMSKNTGTDSQSASTSESDIPPRQPFPILNVPMPSYMSKNSASTSESDIPSRVPMPTHAFKQPFTIPTYKMKDSEITSSGSSISSNSNSSSSRSNSGFENTDIPRNRYSGIKTTGKSIKLDQSAKQYQ